MVHPRQVIPAWKEREAAEQAARTPAKPPGKRRKALVDQFRDGEKP